MCKEDTEMKDDFRLHFLTQIDEKMTKKKKRTSYMRMTQHVYQIRILWLWIDVSKEDWNKDTTHWKRVTTKVIERK